MSKFPAQSYRAIAPAMALAISSAFAAKSSPALAATCPASAGATISTTTTSTQSVANGATCTVTTTGKVSISGGSTAAATLTSSGGTTTLVNSGTIEEISSATGRAVQTSGTGQNIVIQNNLGATIHTVDNDTVAVGTGSGNTVSSAQLTNAGTIQSDAGGQAVNFNKIQAGTNSITNSGLIKATSSDAVRPGVNGTVSNTGTILSIAGTDTGADGIDAQQNTGVSITNAGNFSGSTPGTGLIEGARHGITGGNTSGTGVFGMSITNNLGGTIQGDNGSGINIDGINGNELVTIVNNGTITGNGHNVGDGATHDGDGVDVDGLVNLTNTGTIRSLNAYTPTGLEFSEGVTVGGGTITNSGTIEGSVTSGNTTAVGRGITIAGVDKDVNDNPIPVQAPYAATTITNSGLIKGDTDSAIIFSSGLASGFTHTITNQTGGVIQTGSTSAPAILTAADSVIIKNYGTIDGSSSGKAITGGSAAISVQILGGAAAVLGDINGGTSGASTASLDPGSGNSFSYSGAISNFSSVEVKSGSVTLYGANTYAGTTKITGGTLILSGTNRISAASALDLNGGALALANTGGANAETFASLSLTNSSSIDLGLSSLSFGAIDTVSSGSTLAISDWSDTTSPGYAFRVLGNDTTNAAFLALVADTTIDGAKAGFAFDGQYTDVAPVPIGGTGMLLISGVGLLMLAGTRRRQNVSA